MMMPYFPPHLTSASALAGEGGIRKLRFSLKCCMLFQQQTRRTH